MGEGAGEGSTVYTGRFWLPGEPDEHRPGRLDLSGRWPRLELAEPLTPWLRQDSETTSPDGSVLRRWAPVDEGPDAEALTVHGRLAGVAGEITLAGVYTIARRGAEQQLQARHALRGGHEPGLDARFSHARLRVQHLDDWAQLDGFALEFSTTADGMSFDESFARITYQKPTVQAVQVPDGLGALRLVDRVETPDPTVRGTALTRQVWLELASPDSRTVDELWSAYVAPVSILLTLAVDTDCPPVALQVTHTGDGPWLDVHHPAVVRAGADRPPRHQLLYREHLGLSEVAAWLAANPRLRPLPALIAGVRIGSERTVENQLFELTTAAEGLHRRLFPDQRGLDAKTVERIRAPIEQATDLTPELKERALGALAVLGQPSFAQRLTQLLDRASSALPTLIRDPERWVRDLKRSRNTFAHRLKTGQDLPDMRGWWDQRESLRWVLTIVLLLEAAGVPADVLAQRLQQHQPYRYYERAASRQWPVSGGPATTGLSNG